MRAVAGAAGTAMGRPWNKSSIRWITWWNRRSARCTSPATFPQGDAIAPVRARRRPLPNVPASATGRDKPVPYRCFLRVRAPGWKLAW